MTSYKESCIIKLVAYNATNRGKKGGLLVVNINKLKGKIVEKGLTIEEIATKIGLDRSTLYRRFSQDGETFSIREANLICSILELSSKEATAIFFSNYVA